MGKSTTSIIDHIPSFLNYCQRINLSDKTQENYKRFLNKFIFWLKKEDKKTLLPHELTANNIQAYKFYLSQSQDEKGRLLKKITQNYYLIALRALLNYFMVKDISSISVGKINLLDINREVKDFKKEKSAKILALDLDLLEKLLSMPNTKAEAGLRDRALLETIISTGLRVSRLIKLNKDEFFHNVHIPTRPLKWIKEYLRIRKDKNKALFINYRSRRDSDKRLTARSVEKIINKYGKKANFPFLITPDILRWAYPLAILNEGMRPKMIQEPQVHKTFMTNNYKYTIDRQQNNFSSRENIKKQPFSSWHIVENIINEETIWLKDNISVLPEGYKDNPPFLRCDDCIFRKIATLITSGKVEATELLAEGRKDLWNNLTKRGGLQKISYHGKEWHKKMMDVICEYFRLQNYKVVFEPLLNYGRADLGAHLNSKNNLYIEVGTVSPFKLWYNLSTMKNTTFLIIPEEDYVIEFKT